MTAITGLALVFLSPDLGLGAPNRLDLRWTAPAARPASYVVSIYRASGALANSWVRSFTARRNATAAQLKVQPGVRLYVKVVSKSGK